MTSLDIAAIDIPAGEDPDRAAFGRYAYLAEEGGEFDDLWFAGERKWVIGSSAVGPIAYCGILDRRWIYRGQYVWLIPLAGMDKKPRHALRVCEAYLQKLQAQFGKELWCYIDMRIPSCAKLVKLLGFKNFGWHFAHAGTVQYMYVRGL